MILILILGTISDNKECERHAVTPTSCDRIERSIFWKPNLFESVC